MDTSLVIAIIIVAVLVVAGITLWLVSNNRRSSKLQDTFGAEYPRLVKERGRGEAEKELEARQKRVEKLNLKQIPPVDAQRYAEQWRLTQARFVDDPPGAINEADVLIGRVMEARGYPLGDFEQRSADISVEHPQVVTNYRMAHDISQRASRGEASTEDLRRAMVHYRSLFDELTQPAMAESGQRK